MQLARGYIERLHNLFKECVSEDYEENTSELFFAAEVFFSDTHFHTFTSRVIISL